MSGVLCWCPDFISSRYAFCSRPATAAFCAAISFYAEEEARKKQKQQHSIQLKVWKNVL
jgi:hypothetical protein